MRHPLLVRTWNQGEESIVPKSLMLVPDQHLQLDQQRVAERGGDDGHCVMDDRLYILRLRGSPGLRRTIILLTGKGFEALSGS